MFYYMMKVGHLCPWFSFSFFPEPCDCPFLCPVMIQNLFPSMLQVSLSCCHGCSNIEVYDRGLLGSYAGCLQCDSRPK